MRLIFESANDSNTYIETFENVNDDIAIVITSDCLESIGGSMSIGLESEEAQAFAKCLSKVIREAKDGKL